MLLSKAKNLIGKVAGPSTRARRSDAAAKAATTRKRNADARSTAARKAARTRKQRDGRVEAMVEATRRD
ncbi:MAG: hypothetical protein QOE05_652 [Actinomycetota bacterium]|nr:hypothetical protein [Actinomycetota bacterium]